MAKTSTLMRCQWSGAEFVPTRHYTRAANERFVVGEIYEFQIYSAASDATRSHYFVCVQMAWENLPEDIADEYPSPEHLRKRALIQAGYYDERYTEFDTKADAMRFAAMLAAYEPFDMVDVAASTVRHRIAKSQSKAAMGGKHEFAKSKDAVLAVLSELIGVDVTTLTRQAPQI